jgi:hypothetical protein
MQVDLINSYLILMTVASLIVAEGLIIGMQYVIDKNKVRKIVRRLHGCTSLGNDKSLLSNDLFTRKIGFI